MVGGTQAGQTWKGAAIVAFLPAAAIFAAAGPHGLSWLVTCLTLLCGIISTRPGWQRIWRAATPDARILLYLFLCFAMWTAIRTVTAPDVAEAGWATAGFLFAALSSIAGFFLIANIKPEGRWHWLYFPSIQMICAVLFVATVVYFSYQLKLRPPAQRHENIYHYNRAAVFLVLMLPLALHGAMRNQTTAPRKACWMVTPALLTGFAIYQYSESETAKLAFIVTCSLYAGCVLFAAFVRRILMVSVPLATLAAPFLLNLVFAPLYKFLWLFDYMPGTILARLVIWQSHFALIRNAFWAGNGVEYFRLYGSVDPNTNAPLVQSHAHSFVFQVWADLGFVGATLLALLLAAAFRWTRTLTRAEQPLFISMMAGMVAVWAVSHGMWQSWYIGMCGLLVMLAILSANRSEIEPGAEYRALSPA